MDGWDFFGGTRFEPQLIGVGVFGECMCVSCDAARKSHHSLLRNRKQARRHCCILLRFCSFDILPLLWKSSRSLFVGRYSRSVFECVVQDEWNDCVCVEASDGDRPHASRISKVIY